MTFLHCHGIVNVLVRNQFVYRLYYNKPQSAPFVCFETFIRRRDARYLHVQRCKEMLRVTSCATTTECFLDYSGEGRIL